MKEFLLKNNLAIITALGALVLSWTLVSWQQMPMTQRCVGLFVAGVVVHLWEEGRFPGGFTRMITERLGFTQSDPRFGGLVTDLLVLLVGFVPFLFPGATFLVFAAVSLGFVESFAHVVAIRMFRTGRPYTPGMASALAVLLPISVYTTWYLVASGLMEPQSWALALAYLLACVAVAQQVVVRTSGMRYSEFLGNVRKALRG
jgi:hypothetical protein